MHVMHTCIGCTTTISRLPLLRTDVTIPPYAHSCNQYKEKAAGVTYPPGGGQEEERGGHDGGQGQVYALLWSIPKPP